MDNGFIAIELSQIDADAFVTFQKYYKKINYLVAMGAMEHKDGSIEIHIDSEGHWKNVKLIKNNYPQNLDS